MTDKAKELRAAYKREWNRKNPEKRRAYDERYWEKKAAEIEAAEKAGRNQAADVENN